MYLKAETQAQIVSRLAFALRPQGVLFPGKAEMPLNQELQSTNDEPQAINDVLRERTDQVTTLNHFMQSIVGSFDASVVVLDSSLTVRLWSEAAPHLALTASHRYGSRQDWVGLDNRFRQS